MTKVTTIIHDLCAFPAISNILVYIVMKSQVYRENMTMPAFYKQHVVHLYYVK